VFLGGMLANGGSYGMFFKIEKGGGKVWGSKGESLCFYILGGKTLIKSWFLIGGEKKGRKRESEGSAAERSGAAVK